MLGLKKQAPKPKWTEEDEDNFRYIIGVLHCVAHQTFEDVESTINWFKFLKDRVQPQNMWKPSKEQIVALQWILNNIPYNKHKEEISGLLDQIKDL